MATRVRVPVTRRPSLPLTEQDERDLELIRTSPRYRAALANLSGTPDEAMTSVSEAALLHAVFAVGVDAVRVAAQEAGYAELAAQQSSESSARRAAARRRRPSWADEA
ncbi:MAG: hypothetical protein ACOYXW_08690 [Actinomycetota bacterium]